MGGSASNDQFVVIGAGPAGLTAAYELVKRGRSPIVIEQGNRVGGLARTESYRGFRFDLGGHRFFTKAAPVLAMWHEVLGAEFLRRPRLSRIYYNGKFFAYPLKPVNALRGLGVWPTVLVLASYLRWRLMPYPRESTFEQWVTNRFGRRLFRIFFQAYTEKVWGVSCSELKAEWAAQRIKDLSLLTAALNMFVTPRRTIKTLIEEFHYPRLGPGMMWETVRDAVVRAGATVTTDAEVVGLRRVGNRIASVEVARSGGRDTVAGTHFISSMTVSDLIARLDPPAPPEVRDAAERLRYRDFLTVCLIVDRPDVFPDNWIYVHDPGVKVSRIQNFKNWSPDMVPDASKTSLGFEYFCTQGDELWRVPDAELVALARQEVERIGLARSEDVADGCVIRVPKAYPIYESAYAECLAVVRRFVDGLENLQTVGRNGLHRYNNQDHAMMTGMLAVRNAVLGERHDVWSVNTEPDYQEEDTAPPATAPARASAARTAVTRAAAVLLGVVIMYARQPGFFTAPRFWAEEGNVFFLHAWMQPWWKTLFAAPLDYLSLYTNLSAVLASRIVPLEDAPLVTTLAAFLVQAAPLVFLACAVAPEWRGARRYVAMAIVLFGSLTDEVWLTTLHSHYYFALIAFFILLEPSEIGRVRGAVYAALLGLTGLAGPVSCFLAPLFVLKAYRSRRPADVAQAAVLCGAALLQGTLALAGAAGRHQGVSDLVARGPGPEPGPAAPGLASFPYIVWMKTIVLPVFGMDAAEGFMHALADITDPKLVSLEAMVLAVPLFVLAVIFIGWLTLGLPPRLRWWVTGSYALVAGLSINLAFGDKRMLIGNAMGCSRYVYVPGVVFLVLLLQNVRREPHARPSLRAVVCALLLAVGLAAGVGRYRAALRWAPDWPDWRLEARAWREQPARPLALHPVPWMVRLPPRRS